jgi:hypothetical protein
MLNVKTRKQHITFNDRGAVRYDYMHITTADLPQDMYAAMPMRVVISMHTPCRKPRRRKQARGM